MSMSVRKTSKIPGHVSQDGKNRYSPLPKGLRCSDALCEGVGSIAGAATLAIAAVGDMLAGTITPKEASVIITASGHVLKATALHLRYAKASSLQLPGAKLFASQESRQEGK